MNGLQSDTTNSLSLAVDARKAVKALVAFRRSGLRDEQLRQVLSDAVASLNALNAGTSLFANLKSGLLCTSHTSRSGLFRKFRRQFQMTSLLRNCSCFLASLRRANTKRVYSRPFAFLPPSKTEPSRNIISRSELACRSTRQASWLRLKINCVRMPPRFSNL